MTFYQPAQMATITDVTASTLAPTVAQSGTTFVLDRAAGQAITLPSIDAGEVGTMFDFLVKTTITTNTTTIKVPSSAETMTGSAVVQSDSSNAVIAYKAGSTSDTVTLDGSTKGGIAGDIIRLKAVSTTLWEVLAITSATGAEASPFSATVS